MYEIVRDTQNLVIRFTLDAKPFPTYRRGQIETFFRNVNDYLSVASQKNQVYINPIVIK